MAQINASEKVNVTTKKHTVDLRDSKPGPMAHRPQSAAALSYAGNTNAVITETSVKT